MQHFQTVADKMLDGIIISRQDATIIYVNPAIGTMSGFGDTLLKMSILDLYALPEIHGTERERSQLRGQWEGTRELHRPDGTTWIAQVSSVLIEDQEANQATWVSTFRDITAQQRAEQRLRLFEQIVENTPDSIGTGTPPAAMLTYVNTAFTETMGYSREEAIGMPIMACLAENPEHIQSAMREGLAKGSWQGVLMYKRKDGSTFPALLSAFNTYDANGQPDTMIGLFRDMSSHQQAEQERLALQQQVIDAQQASLRELSTPLIPIADGLLVLPLIGTVDNHRAQDMMDVLLTGIAEQQATTVIIDITGMPVVDTQVGNTLLRVAQAANLLGAQVILTGIRPEVAQTLVGLGVDLSTLVTRSTLQNGIAYALKTK